MHEWALAEAVIEEVKKHFDPKKGQKIGKVLLRFGELQKVDREVFFEGLSDLIRADELNIAIPNTAFTAHTEPATFRCRSCNHEWALADVKDLDDDIRESIHFMPETVHAFLSCPSCKSADFSVEDGRGVTIQSIDILDGGAG